MRVELPIIPDERGVPHVVYEPSGELTHIISFRKKIAYTIAPRPDDATKPPLTQAEREARFDANLTATIRGICAGVSTCKATIETSYGDAVPETDVFNLDLTSAAFICDASCVLPPLPLNA